jgi:peroxiredoxin-like protein
MSGKKGKHLFQVQLNWLNDDKGLLSAKDALGTLHVSTPPAFGGVGKPWTPEHFFLGAVSSCFMTTYLAFAKKLQFEFIDLECEAIGQIEVVEGKYKFTQIDLYPKVYLESEELRETAGIAMEKAHKYCLISNSINAAIFYHSEILIRTPLDPAEQNTKGSFLLTRELN